jgi:hypothetical protein
MGRQQNATFSFPMTALSVGEQLTAPFRDLTQDLMRAVRKTMFRSAILAANVSDSQDLIGHETFTVPTYQSHHTYLGLAVLFTALSWLATVLVLIG